MAKNLNRGNVAALSILVPWGFAVVGAIVGHRYEQEGDEMLASVVPGGAIVLGLLVSVYCAYLYVRDKERHWFWALAAVFSMWGWIVLWVLPDRSSK
jgi:uncharacterized membrane protein YjjB (DUF3815 family)